MQTKKDYDAVLNEAHVSSEPCQGLFKNYLKCPYLSAATYFGGV